MIGIKVWHKGGSSKGCVGSEAAALCASFFSVACRVGRLWAYSKSFVNTKA